MKDRERECKREKASERESPRENKGAGEGVRERERECSHVKRQQLKPKGQRQCAKEEEEGRHTNEAKNLNWQTCVRVCLFVCVCFCLMSTGSRLLIHGLCNYNLCGGLGAKLW